MLIMQLLQHSKQLQGYLDFFDGQEEIPVQFVKSLIWPHLEYAALVWASVITKDKDKLESTQNES